jgi:hypothetical protein
MFIHIQLVTAEYKSLEMYGEGKGSVVFTFFCLIISEIVKLTEAHWI